MHRIVPELIIEKYRAGQFQGTFRAVGMFLDLSGFSNLTDALMKQGQHGAEVLVGLMHNIFDPVVTSIFEHGGKIVGFAGDGIMALFPVHTDERTTALNALASAWWIQQSLATRSAEQTSYGSFSFSAKIGLSLGDVSWGILTSRDLKSATYYFRGTAVDDSAGAEHVARAGEIHLSLSMHDALKADVAADEGAAFHRLAGIRSELPGPSLIVLPPADASASRVFVPENILTRDARGEFRQAVNLFMRFPELPNEKLQEFIQKLFELQEQYGGMLSRLDFGDKGCNMLILWGAPVAYENDIGRALNFVLDLKSQVDFPITAGVTYYIAHAGFLGGAMCECYTCYGWGVNLASRFMMSAPTGGIWIDERIARRIKNRFDFEYQGAQNFKGFDTEQKVFVLHGRKPYVEAFHQGEFVGRDVELSRLTDFLQPLWQGQSAGLHFIWGEAGIGKSRLVYELKVSPALKDRGALWAFCHSDQVLRHSFNPFRYWLLRYFGIASETDDASRKQAFNQKLNDLIAQTPDLQLADNLKRVRFALGALMDLYWPDSLYEKLDAEGRYNNTLLALTDIFKAESLRQPVILFIEDAQFLDEDSRAFLPRLKRALANYQVAILISSRRAGPESEFEESLSGKAIELGALSGQALASLAEIHLGGTASPELVRLLQERSEGNPYFAEQILVYLQEEHFLEMSAEGWRTTRLLQDAALPSDISALLMARLDQLDENVRDAIQTASVLGREFDVSVLSAILADRPSLGRDLSVAERAEILLPLGRDRFTFTHGLLRDSAYAMQMSTRRRELHFLAVEALEEIYKEEIEHHYGQLAFHAERADLKDKALHYLTLEGNRAFELYQNAQAADYFSRALALLPETEYRARFDLLLERVEVYKRVGNREAQLADIEAMEEYSGRLNDDERVTRALIHHSRYFFITSDFSRALDMAEQVIRSMGSRYPALVSDAFALAASSLLRLGRLDESMKRANEGVVLANRTGTRRIEAELLTGLGLINIEKNDLSRAMEYLTEAAKIASDISESVIEFSAMNNLGNAAAYLGDYSFARECYERAYTGACLRGDRYGESLTLGNLGWISGMQGDFAASRVFHQQALSISREIGNSYQEAYTLINLSAVFAIQGDAVPALECARLGNEICRKTGERSGEAWTLLNMGHAYLLAEELELAQSAYNECLTIRRELRQPNLAAEALAGLMQIALYQDDNLSLSRYIDNVLIIMEDDKDISGAEEPLRIYYACYQGLKKLEDTRALGVLTAGKRLLDSQTAKIKDEGARRMYVENVPWRRALGMI